MSEKSGQVFKYHQQSKHHFNHYANSPGFLDWDNQPNPFRFYQGSEQIKLPFLKTDPPAKYSDLLKREKNAAQLFSIQNIAGFLELSLAISSWKTIGRESWSLRINPSSGNLHPTECHLILPQMGNVESGIFHYNVFQHSLERRAELPAQFFKEVKTYFQSAGILVALTSIFWRESWKYGERAYRYCNHDAGHALAALCLSANLFGWRLRYLNETGTETIRKILGLGESGEYELEDEHPDLICYLFPANREIPAKKCLPNEALNIIDKIKFSGKPNRLSRQPVNWDIIYQTAAATRKPEGEPETVVPGSLSGKKNSQIQKSAAAIIRQRRSAFQYNPQTSRIEKSAFLEILDQTIPGENCPPFDLALQNPLVHLLLFVHNVTSLTQGLYFFIRNEAHFQELKKITDSAFLWKKVEQDIPLYLLKSGNFRDAAKLLSCQQDIGGDSAFSLGMIARFREVLEKMPWKYPALFWECGIIGQILYLAAEAQELRGTGIGCFFDDEVHKLIGLKSDTYQSLYHFTIGNPVEDYRLTSLPAYHHLKTKSS